MARKSDDNFFNASLKVQKSPFIVDENMETETIRKIPNSDIVCRNAFLQGRTVSKHC